MILEGRIKIRLVRVIIRCAGIVRKVEVLYIKNSRRPIMKKPWERVIKFLRDPATQTIVAIIIGIATIAWGSIQGWLLVFADWLLKKQTQLPNWILFSIFILVSILIMNSARRKYQSNKKSILSKANLSEHPKPDTFSLPPLPREILDQIDSATPYQKSNIEQSFEGIKIKWKLIFWDIVEIDNNIVWLQLTGDDEYGNIYIHADITKYPRIKTLHRKEIVFVIADIEKITDHHTVWLINADLKFSGEA
jgi:hypothetical protein